MNQLASIDVEKAVLGTITTRPEELMDVVDMIRVDTFTDTTHQIIYRSILDLEKDSKPIDPLSIANLMTEYGEQDAVKSIYSLTNDAVTNDLLSSYVEILRKKEVAREQLLLAQEIQLQVHDPGIDPLDVTNMICKSSDSLVELTDLKKPISSSDIVDRVLEAIDKAIENGTAITGVPSGFDELDKIYAGAQKGDLIVSAARPGMGKTALVISKMLNMALKYDVRVLFFSLEMSVEQLMQRAISQLSDVELWKIRTGRLSNVELGRIKIASRDLRSENIVVVDDVYTLSGIRSRAKKESMAKGVGFIMVDYIQLVVNNLGSGRSRENEVSEISRSFKMLAKDLDIPVQALAQLSRAVETRGGDKRPILSDLRESGAIEQDADVVEFLYRPGYYGMMSEEGYEYPESMTEIIIAKHRHGATKTVELKFVPECTRFENAEFIA